MASFTERIQYPPTITSGSFSGATTGATINLMNQFSVSIGGTFNATIVLERSPDNVNWFPCSTDGTGTAAVYTQPVSVDVVSLIHPMFYRLRCSAYTSGTANWIVSQ